MSEKLCLDNNFSTTQIVTRDKPKVEKGINDKLDSVLFLPESEERQGEGGLRTDGYFKQSYDEKPLISVVTVVYNGDEHLEQTIKSVIEQSYDNVEYIIVDGGSSDGTLDIIRRYEEQIDYWVSERDGGIYDAMNKAISLTSGDWVNFMNAGDSFYSEETHKILFQYDIYENIDIIYGNTMNFYDTNQETIRRVQPLKTFYKGIPFSHQSAFVRQNLLKLDPFDENLRIAADYEFFYKHYRRGSQFYFVNEIIDIFDMNGFSSTYDEAFLERRRVVDLHEPNKIGYYSTWRLYIIKLKLMIRNLLPKKISNYIRVQLVSQKGR